MRVGPPFLFPKMTLYNAGEAPHAHKVAHSQEAEADSVQRCCSEHVWFKKSRRTTKGLGHPYTTQSKKRDNCSHSQKSQALCLPVFSWARKGEAWRNVFYLLKRIKFVPI